MYEHPSEPERRNDTVKDEIEYVGSPTEFADIDEVPEWVATLAKILFFLPTAFFTATAMPFFFLGLALVVCLCLFIFGVLVASF